jgi:glycosyltransferase involved in cell wall biosynthesis
LNNSDNEEDHKPLELIQKLNLEKQVVVFNEFIPNEEVHRYFQVSDALILFYLTATPSGVESIGYNFKMPILATKVGHFAETVIPGYNGYLANAEDVNDMARIMELSISNPIDRNNVVETAKNMSWNRYASAVAK